VDAPVHSFLHDALPICGGTGRRSASVRFGAHGGHEIRLERLIGSTALSPRAPDFGEGLGDGILGATAITVEAQSEVKRGQLVPRRSEEHTSELQSRFDLVCRLLL